MSEKTPAVTIRDAGAIDRGQLRRAIVELQEYERKLQNTRLPGEQIADAYLAWMQNQVGEGGALLIAEIDRCFVGFVAGWIEYSDAIAETPDSNRFGYISEVCVMPEFRGQRIATRLLSAIEERLSRTGSPAFVSARWPQTHRHVRATSGRVMSHMKSPTKNQCRIAVRPSESPKCPKVPSK